MGADDAGTTSPAPKDAYRPFVPRRGRAMAFAAAVLMVIVFGVIAFVMLPTGGPAGWTMIDRWALFLFGCALGLLLSRWGRVKAVPTPEGITVRNLFLTRHVVWGEVVGVQFGGGRAWCTLDLADTEQLAIMAIQRADGPPAVAEAQRLAALVEVGNRAVSTDQEA